MEKNILKVVVLAGVSTMLFTGFGFGDIESAVPKSGGDCDTEDCKNKAQIENAAKVVAIGAAAKLIHDMVISFESDQTGSESSVVKKYKKEHNKLPSAPLVYAYKSSLKPGSVIKAGKEVTVESMVEVVPGTNSKSLKIQEKIDIYDSEDNKKILKSLVKTINGTSGKSGAFKNKFKFSFPVGMPEGIYPIKTHVLVDKKPFKPEKNKLQLVLRVNTLGKYKLAAVTLP